MSEEQLAEARAWVALDGWRWMPGMVDVDGVRVVDVDPGGWLWVVDDCGQVDTVWPGDLTEPDVTDPATIGCLWALAREITGKPHLEVRWMPLDGCYKAVWPVGDTGLYGWTSGYDATPSAALLRACQEHEGVSRG